MTSSPQTSPTAGALTFCDYYARLFAYDRWANRRVLETMASLGSRLPQRPVDRLNHLLICQTLWIARMTGRPTPENIFPTWPLAELQKRAPGVFDSMEQFLDSLSDQDLHKPAAYTSMEGESLQGPPADALTQLYGHGCYHRGQIACELNPLLPKPLVTDYIYYRKAIQGDDGQLV